MTLGELVVVLCHKEDQLTVEETLKRVKEYLDLLVSDRNIDAGTLSEITGFLDKSWKLFESMEVNCDVGAKPLIPDREIKQEILDQDEMLTPSSKNSEVKLAIQATGHSEDTNHKIDVVIIKGQKCVCFVRVIRHKKTLLKGLKYS